MQAFNFNIPTKIIFGTGKIKTIQNEISDTIKNILIVTDQNLHSNTDIIRNIRTLLSEYDIQVFDQIEENPNIESVDMGAAFARKHHVSYIIGVGGGSSMDAAKGIALLSTNKGKFSDYLEGNKPQKDPIPIMCIPTTSGTGSEVTPFVVFTDKLDQSKKGFSHPSIFPVTSIIDPELTYSMPMNVRIDTGLDVLAHSAEAYLSLDSNALNDQIALIAIDLVINNLQASVENQKDAIAQMSYASMLAGIAITHASTILPHIMGYPLTVFHGVAHGRASILTLPAFLAYLKGVSGFSKKLKKLESIFNQKSGLISFLEQLEVSVKLRDYGIKDSEIDLFVEKTIHKGDIKITPGKINKKVIRQLYADSI